MFLRAPAIAGFETRCPTGNRWCGLYELPDASPFDPSSGDFTINGEERKREQ